MNRHILFLTAIMALMGVLGGLINYFINGDTESKPRKDCFREVLKACIIGIGASLLVPLFLNMISSDLLKETESSQYNILVFAGFCLIAAITSKTFIGTISERILQEAEEANAQAREAKKKIEQVESNIRPIINKATEQDYNDEDIIEEDNLGFNEGDLEEIVILKAIANGKYTYRTLNGLSKVTKLKKEVVNEKLTQLITEGFITQTQRENGIRYCITERGRRELFSLDKFPRY